MNELLIIPLRELSYFSLEDYPALDVLITNTKQPFIAGIYLFGGYLREGLEPKQEGLSAIYLSTQYLVVYCYLFINQLLALMLLVSLMDQIQFTPLHSEHTLTHLVCQMIVT